MSAEEADFLQAVAADGNGPVERAIALLWIRSSTEPAVQLSASKIARTLERAGIGKHNSSRLEQRLRRDARTVVRSGEFSLKLDKRSEVEEAFGKYAGPRPAPETDSVLDHELFANARPYTRKVVYQINASYDHALFDCCAVMCRRMLETLVIEAYENLSMEQNLKTSANGHYLMFGSMIKQVEKDKQMLSMGRGAFNALKGLKGTKTIGDASAHSRYYNALQSDIDDVKRELRVAAEALLHLAGQAP